MSDEHMRRLVHRVVFVLASLAVLVNVVAWWLRD